MPNPIITDYYRAQVVLQGKSGLPDDVYVNTFGFENVGAGSQTLMADAIQDRLNRFYTEVVAQTGTTVASWLSGTLVNPEATIKIYDLGQAPPRVVFERPLTLPLGAGAALPPEVAVTASFYGTRSLPRQRGRVYLGPIISSALEFSVNRIRVGSSLRTTLCHAMRRMSQFDANNIAEWSVVSPTAVAGYKVTAGWVDDAPDTQRRRGHAAQLRHTWDADGVQEVAE